MFKWFKDFTERRRRRDFDAGYNYAAGVLLQSNGNCDPRDEIVQPETEFDAGIREACLDWHAHEIDIEAKCSRACQIRRSLRANA